MSWYIGADPASHVAALAAISETGELRHTELRVRGQLPTRLVELRRQAREWLRFAADDGVWCVCVERPSTRYGGASLLAAFGVVVEACASMLAAPVLTLVPSEIDGAALGRSGGQGARRKQRLTAHARQLGYVGGSQDVADAVVCADAARALTARSRRAAAA